MVWFYSIPFHPILFHSIPFTSKRLILYYRHVSDTSEHVRASKQGTWYLLLPQSPLPDFVKCLSHERKQGFARLPPLSFCILPKPTTPQPKGQELNWFHGPYMNSTKCEIIWMRNDVCVMDHKEYHQRNGRDREGYQTFSFLILISHRTCFGCFLNRNWQSLAH